MLEKLCFGGDCTVDIRVLYSTYLGNAAFGMCKRKEMYWFGAREERVSVHERMSACEGQRCAQKYILIC